MHCNAPDVTLTSTSTISFGFTLGEAAGITSPDFSPSSFSYKHRQTGSSSTSSSNNDNDDSEEIDLGTTLVAIKYNGGVVVGADTRTSVGGYVSNKFAYKINPIFEERRIIGDENDEPNTKESESGSAVASSCVVCRSGSAADTQWLAKQAKRRFAVRTLERPRYTPTVSEVAHYLRYQMRNSNSNNNGNGFQASLICAGYDEEQNGGRIFGITPGGSLWEEDNFCVSGSGSTILLGYLDDALQQHSNNNNIEGNYFDFSKEQALALVTKLLRLSIGRDGSSGGLVRLYVVDRTGLEETTVYPDGTSKTSSSEQREPLEAIDGDGASKETTTYTELEGFATPS